MKTALSPTLLCALCCATLGASAQNLVENPGFEQIDDCPVFPDLLGYGEASTPTGWWSWSDTPDYFNSCIDTLCSVPGNLMGFQPAYAGAGYSGFFSYYANAQQTRDMIGTELSAPLQPGVTYYASMRVSPAFGGFYNIGAFSDHMGLLFTMERHDGGISTPSFPLRNHAQVWQDSIITDTSGWSLVRGSFVADSAYQYLAIGNHFDNVHTDTLQSGIGFIYYTYYFVDEVCVSADPNGCDMGIGMDEARTSAPVLVPNPAGNDVRILNASPDAARYRLLDALGRNTASATWRFGDAVDVSNIAPGAYVLQLLDRQNGVLGSSRFVKE